MWQLIALRFLTGIGMGGAAPNVYTLASEFSPTRHRGLVMLLAGLGLPVGAIVGGLIAGLVIPVWGWQGVFVIGGVAPLLALPALMRVFPESPYYLARQDRQVQLRTLLARVAPASAPSGDTVFSLPEPPARVGAMALLSSELRHNTLAIWATYFFNWVAWFGLVLWIPSVLSAAGLPREQAGLATVTLNGAALVFMLPLAWWLPRLPVRQVILWLLGGAVGISAVLAIATGAGSVNWLLVFAAVGLSGLLVGAADRTQLPGRFHLPYGGASQRRRLGNRSGPARHGGRWRCRRPGAGGFRSSGFFWALMLPLSLAGVAAVMVRDTGQSAGGDKARA